MKQFELLEPKEELDPDEEEDPQPKDEDETPIYLDVTLIEGMEYILGDDEDV